MALVLHSEPVRLTFFVRKSKGKGATAEMAKQIITIVWHLVSGGRGQERLGMLKCYYY